MNTSNEYQWPYHGSKLISKDKLKPYLKRNNISGLIHLSLHLTLIAFSGSLIYLIDNFFLKIFIMIAHGTFISFFS